MRSLASLARHPQVRTEGSEHIRKSLQKLHSAPHAARQTPFYPETPDFAPHRTKPMLMPVDWDRSVSRTTLVLSEGNLIDDAGLGRAAIDVASAPAQLIEIMKGDL